MVGIYQSMETLYRFTSRTTGISISEDEALHVVLEIDNRHISDKNGVGAVAGEV